MPVIHTPQSRVPTPNFPGANFTGQLRRITLELYVRKKRYNFTGEISPETLDLYSFYVRKFTTLLGSFTG